tara:strand:+ start:2420 stop:2830 length:411 start_codon:yes stop_codon:yes gene_type:complete
MQQELQDKVYNWVADTAETIGDWTSKEVPLFITEFLTWRFWESMIGIIQYGGGFICVSIMSFLYYKFCHKAMMKHGNDIDDDGELKVIATVVTSIIAIVTVFIIFANFPTENIKTCIQIKLAPKVYLVEEAIKLTK